MSGEQLICYLGSLASHKLSKASRTIHNLSADKLVQVPCRYHSWFVHILMNNDWTAATRHFKHY